MDLVEQSGQPLQSSITIQVVRSCASTRARKLPELRSTLRSGPGSSKSNQSAPRKHSQSQVVLPVHRGPKRKKVFPGVASKRGYIASISAANRSRPIQIVGSPYLSNGYNSHPSLSKTMPAPYRLLIVDDEEDVRTAVKRRLERQGFEVDTAESAEAGIERIQNADPPYDVIVTDMSMEDPEAGVQILQAAFGRDVFAEVIVMTAYGNVKNAVECMKRGAFDYIEKNIPGVDVYELLTIKVEQALDRRRQSTSAMRSWGRPAGAKT